MADFLKSAEWNLCKSTNAYNCGIGIQRSNSDGVWIVQFVLKRHNETICWVSVYKIDRTKVVSLAMSIKPKKWNGSLMEISFGD